MKNYWFQKSLKFVAAAVLAISPLAVSAHGMHKHKPLSLEELPEICRQYFARADECYKKAGKKADFQRNNTKFLFHRCLRQIWDNGNVCAKLRWILLKRKQAISIANRGLPIFFQTTFV